MLTPDSTFGYARTEDVEDAMTKRLAEAATLKEIAVVASDAVAALQDINSSIPVQHKHRHLVAPGLENFCNG